MSQEPPIAQTFKILLVGDSGTGKSCLLVRFAEGGFCREYCATIGVDFRLKNVLVEDKYYRLQVWDTAGQERFRTITSSYYRGAHVILLVFDLGNAESFLSVTYWLQEINRYNKETLCLILVGSKADLEERAVSEAEARAVADNLGISYFECSAKEGRGVEEIFLAATLACKQRVALKEKPLDLDKPRGKWKWISRC